MSSVATANQDIAMAYSKVFGTPEGKLVLEHILTRVCLLDAPIVITSELSMASQVGARNIGLIIKSFALASITVSRPNVVTEKESI